MFRKLCKYLNNITFSYTQIVWKKSIEIGHPGQKSHNTDQVSFVWRIWVQLGVQGHKTKLNEVRKMYGRVGFANVNLFCLDQIQLLFWIFEFFSKKSSREWKKNCEYVARKDLNAYKNNKLDSNRLKIVNRQDDCSSSWMDWD